MAHVSNLVLFFDSYYFANLHFRFLIFRAWKVKLLVTQSCLTLCDPKEPLSMEFSRQEYWSGLPLPSPGDLPNPGIKPGSPVLQADSSPTELPGKPSIGIKIGK